MDYNYYPNDRVISHESEWEIEEVNTEHENPTEVGTQLLLNSHTNYSHHDTYAENIHKDDQHLLAFRALGYFENFSRIEMLNSA